MRTMVLFLVLCMPTAATATVLVVTDAGYYMMEKNADGVPVLTRIAHVVHMGDAPPVDPVDPDPEPEPEPDPTEPTPQQIAISKQVRGWAEDVGDSDTAQELALMYGTVADSLGDGSIDKDAAYDVARKGADLLLADPDKRDAWQPWRDNAGELISDLQRKGKLEDPLTVVEAFRAIAKGLEASANGSEALPLARVLEVLKSVIDVVKGAGA